MSRTTRFIVAVVLTLILGVGAVGVWAGPRRQGTVPLPPTGGIGGVVTLGNVQISSTGTISANVVADPPAVPDGKTHLESVVEVTTDGSDYKVCYPYPQASEDAEGKIYKWDGSAWEEVGGDVSGTPAMICVTDTSGEGGMFSLIGNQ